jgi:hypothetical protein
MRREQMWSVVLIVAAIHLIPAVAVAWLLLRSEVEPPPSPASPPPRQRPRAVVAPKQPPAKAIAPPRKEPAILRETVVLPTLDTPIPAGKSVVWCASFQMAWDRLREDIVGEPIRLAGADDLVDRLNRNAFTGKAITPENTYAVAGRYEDGIVEKVRKDMAKRFPDVKLPALEELKEGALAFAYLQSRVRFPVPFRNLPKGMEFQDSTGHSRRVEGFGFRAPATGLQEQAVILHYGWSSEEKPPTFAIDPCWNSKPDQLVLARIDRKETLAATLADVEKAIASFPPDSEHHGFIWGDSLWIPVLSLEVEHRFKELEGPNRTFLNERMRGLFLQKAIQSVRFQLDANGADLASMARIPMKKFRPAQHLVFDRPFLLYARKRGEKQPFLVMWIDNSGLMQPHKEPPPMDD